MHFQPKTTFDDTCARARPYTTKNDESKAIFINGQEITQVTSTKFLGIVMDEKLDWSAHKEHLIKKLRSATGALCRIKRSIPPEHYMKIYSSLFDRAVE